MSTVELERPSPARAKAKPAIVDCDIHPAMRSTEDLKPFLSKRWWDHLTTYGSHVRQGFKEMLAYPRMQAEVARRDAWPPNGGPPGSDLDFMRAQHLDANGIAVGNLIPLRLNAGSQRNLAFGAALCSAINDWEREAWCRPEPRLRASLVVSPEDAESAVAEIERCAGDPTFVQVMLPPRCSDPLGRERYWPIYAAAQAAQRPLGLHVGGVSGHPVTAGTGWSSFYIEEHHSQVQTMQALMASLILEGVFEQFRDLKVVLIEAGFAWVPALAWRLDKQWARMRSEVPHVKRPPSEYIREHFWFTTQPIEEPERPQDLVEVMRWVGFDRIMFSTDYPHWDFDDPAFVFPAGLGKDERARIFAGNARAVYGLGPA